MDTTVDAGNPDAAPPRLRAAGTIIDDVLRLEIVAMGHTAPRGRVHVSDHLVAASAGQPSLFNRATAVDLYQPDIGLGECDAFFGKLPHTLWLNADHVSGDIDLLLRRRGYTPLPQQAGLERPPSPVTQEAGEGPGHEYAELLTQVSEAAAIADVTGSSYGLGADDRILLEDLARAILRHAKPWDHGALYGVRHEGRLVATSALLCTTSVAGLAAIATRPEHRHHGYGTAVGARALRDAAALGFTRAAAIATPDSYPVLVDLGFRPSVTYGVYRRGAL